MVSQTAWLDPEHFKLLLDSLSHHFLLSPGVRQGGWCACPSAASLVLPCQVEAAQPLPPGWQSWVPPSAWSQSLGVPRVLGDPSSCPLWVCVGRCLQELGPSQP